MKDKEKVESLGYIPETEKWDKDTFIYAASPDEIGMIQERATARFKSKPLVAGLMESIESSGIFKTEDAKQSALIMALYMHSAYEVGKSAGLRDIDHMVSSTIDEHKRKSSTQPGI